MKYDIALGLICLTSIFCSTRSSLIRFSESSESKMEKLGINPTFVAFCLKNVAPIEWNVPINGGFFVLIARSLSKEITLSCISPAAFLVNVTAKIFSGGTCFCVIR